MRNLYAEAPARFYREALEALQRFGKTADQVPALRLVVATLMGNGMLLRALCDPSLSGDAARTAMRLAAQVDPNTYSTAARFAAESDGVKASGLLGLLSDCAPPDALNSRCLAPLLEHSDPRVRSKAVIMVGRVNRNPVWAQKRMGDGDERVRGNAVESLWGADTPLTRQLLEQGARDPNNRVAGNALFGLYRLGETASIPSILEMAQHAAPRSRATAAWVMGETEDPRFMTALTKLLRDSAPTVRGRALRSMKRVRAAGESAAAAGRLEILLLPRARGDEDWKQVRARVTGDGPVPELRATRFVVTAAGEIVSEYSVEFAEPPAEMEVALIFPESGGEGRDAAARCLAQKRRADRWLLLPYAPAYRRPEPELRFRDVRGVALAAQETGSQVEDLTVFRVTADEETLRLSLAPKPPGIRGSVPFPRAVRLGADAPILGRLRRWVIVLNDGAQELGATPIPSGARVCAVSIRPDEALRNLCIDSGGVFLTAPDLPTASELFQKLYLGTLAQYDIRYRSDDATAVRVQVYSDRGYGEAESSIADPS